MNRLLLIDGNSLTYRGYYATAHRFSDILTNSKGFPINAVLILNNILNKAIKKYNPTHILVAFDAGQTTIRHEKFEAYKSKRKPTPPELIQQMPIVKEMVAKMGIINHEIIGIEADDIVGTLVNKFRNKANILILSSDKDLFQLVQKNVSIIVPQNNSQEDKIINIDNFFDLYGYNPSQVVDMKGIVGDSSDNLPGVMGIGNKGATKLLIKYNNLENIYKHLDELAPNLQAKLVKSQKMAFLCKELAQLLLDVQIPYHLHDLVFKNEITEELITFFQKYELNSLVKKYAYKIKKTKKISPKKTSTFKKIIF